MNPNNPENEIDPNIQTNPSGQPSLSEKDFIRNGWSSMPPWLWLFLIAVISLLLLGSGNWYSGFMQNFKKHDPFWK